jgi:hypothetical protein
MDSLTTDQTTIVMMRKRSSRSKRPAHPPRNPLQKLQPRRAEQKRVKVLPGPLNPNSPLVEEEGERLVIRSNCRMMMIRPDWISIGQEEEITIMERENCIMIMTECPIAHSCIAAHRSCAHGPPVAASAYFSRGGSVGRYLVPRHELALVYILISARERHIIIPDM